MGFENTKSVEEGSLGASEVAHSSAGVEKRNWTTPRLTKLSVSETMGGTNPGQEGYFTAQNRS